MVLCVLRALEIIVVNTSINEKSNSNIYVNELISDNNKPRKELKELFKSFVI